MTIIASTDLSNYNSRGNVNESITLAEQFGLYMIIKVERKTGFFGYGVIKVIDTFEKYNKAVKCYIENGGQMRREF